MKTEAIYPSVSYRENSSNGVIQQFIAWAEKKQSSRLAILAAMLMIHGNLTAPLALYSMHVADGGIFQLILITLCSFAILVVNLAALPTKITIPVYVINTLLLIGLILVNFMVAFS